MIQIDIKALPTETLKQMDKVVYTKDHPDYKAYDRFHELQTDVLILKYQNQEHKSHLKELRAIEKKHTFLDTPYSFTKNTEELSLEESMIVEIILKESKTKNEGIIFNFVIHGEFNLMRALLAEKQILREYTKLFEDANKKIAGNKTARFHNFMIRMQIATLFVKELFINEMV